MTTRPVRVTRLAIDRMPGFPGKGPEMDGLSRGVNLISGPNGSGKTSLARAVRAVLFGSEDPSVAIRARVEVEEDTWSVQLDGFGDPQWSSEDRPDRPDFPGLDVARAYSLSLHDLLSDEDVDFAKRIRIASAGGYDVRAEAEKLGFGSASRPMKLAGTLADAEDRLATAEAEASRLEDQVRKRDRALARLGDLATLRAEKEALRAAVELVRGRRALDEAERNRDAFSDQELLSRIGDDELDRHAGWARELDGLDDQVRRLRTEIRDLSRELDETDLGDDGVPVTTLDELTDLLASARATRDRLSVRKEALAEAGANAPAVGGDSLPDVDLEALDELLRTVEDLRARRARLTDAARKLGDDEATPNRDEIASRLSRLERWLSIPEKGASEGPVERWGPVLIAAVGVVGVTFGVLRSPPDVLLAAVGIVPVIFGVTMLVRTRAAGRTNEREMIEREIGTVSWAPSAWTAERVRARVDELRTDLLEAKEAESRAEERRSVRAALASLDDDERDLRDRLRIHAEAFGLDPDARALRVHQVGTALHTRARAHARRMEVSAVIAEVEGELETTLGRAGDLLEPYDGRPSTVSEFDAALKALKRRAQRHADARRALSDTSARLESVQQDLGRIHEERADRLRYLGLEGIEPDEGRRRIRAAAEHLDAWQAATREADVARRTRDAARTRLEDLAAAGNAGADRLSASGEFPSIEDLDDRLEQVEVEIEELEDLRSEADRITGALETAGTKREVEQARAAVARARHALEVQLADDLEMEVGDVLADWVHERSSEQNRPEVFTRARELFTTLTHGAWELRMDDGDPPSFRALDSRLGVERSLDELSAGTRVQLLLAVRVAFVETQEGQHRMPLVFDEVIANSDDARAQAIIDAALELARAGRQIFYFTAQSDEVDKWRQALDGEGIPHTAIDLASDARPSGSGFTWEADRGGIRRYPPPESDDHGDYGRRLSVPGWDPFEDPVDAVHIWHLLSDPTTIHRLLELQVSAWGPLRRYAEAHGAVPDAVARGAEEARPWATLLQKLGAYWRTGRGRPLTREVIAEADGISETYFERVCDLADELDWRADRLVEELVPRLDRFRQNKADDFREWALERGYIVPEEPLADTVILSRLKGDGEALGLDVTIDELNEWIRRLSIGGGAA